MSNTIAHRPHVQHHHVPLLPVLAVIVAVTIAAVVIYALNQPQEATITTTGSQAITAPLVAPAAIGAPESPVFRHALMRMQMQITGAELQAFKYGRLHQVDGATLEPVSTTPFSLSRAELMAMPTPLVSGDFALPR